MKIGNISKVESTLRAHLLSGLFAVFMMTVSVAYIVRTLLSRMNIFVFITFVIVTIVSVIIAVYDLTAYKVLKHDLKVLQQTFNAIHYDSDGYVCYGSEPLSAFDTIYKTGVDSIYLDTLNHTIIIPGVKVEE